MIKGSCVALVTPFKNGKVNERNLRDLVEFHIANGTSAVVPCGSTGESATLSHAEHGRVIELVITQARGRIPVIAGTGSNSTSETIELTRHAEKSGADAALVIVPYYNKPTQQGMYEHFSTVAKSVSIPIFVYNIPSRTGVNMDPSTLFKIAEKHPTIAGVKESSGNLDQVSEIAHLMRHRKDFTILSGDDSLTLPILSVGGKGVISVLANIAPRDVQELCLAYEEGLLSRALEIHLKLFPLAKALFIETSPAPIKAAMATLKLCSDEMRQPMHPLTPESKKKLLRAVKNYGLRKVK